MKRVISLSVMAILLLSVIVIAHTSSTQIAHAQTNSTALTLPDFNFAAAGDWACTSDTTDTINNILDKNPELAPIQYENLFGFLNVYVSSDERKLVGTFYDNDDDGEIKDQFTITN